MLLDELKYLFNVACFNCLIPFNCIFLLLFLRTFYYFFELFSSTFLYFWSFFSISSSRFITLLKSSGLLSNTPKFFIFYLGMWSLSLESVRRSCFYFTINIYVLFYSIKHPSFILYSCSLITFLALFSSMLRTLVINLRISKLHNSWGCLKVVLRFFAI